MDANFFRFVIHDGTKYLKGSRIEKVFNPIQGVWTFKLSTKVNLIFCHGPKKNFLFFSQNRPENPVRPNAKVGWWRKRVKNKWINDVFIDWPKRRFALELRGENLYLLFDLTKGLFLLNKNPIESYIINWPPLEQVLKEKEIYKHYPHITSPLRYALLNMSCSSKRERVYSKIRAGDVSCFYVYEFEDVKKDPIVGLWEMEDLKGDVVSCFDSSIDAAKYYGWKILQDLQEREKGEDRREKRLRKRIKKERERLLEWLSLEQQAVLIYENLYRFDANKHYSRISLQGRDGNNIEIELDPCMTLIENVNNMFKKVKKAKKGLAILENRLKNGLSIRRLNGHGQIGQKRNSIDIQNRLPLSSRLKGISVKLFLNSDGFYILRGKNQRSNHKLLTVSARPHDLWFHVEGGPGAHVIVVRDNPTKEVPETTILEAAKLAGLASYQKDSGHCRVIGTEVRYVKKIKGMPLGQVEVKKVLYSLDVELDPLIENRLKSIL